MKIFLAFVLILNSFTALAAPGLAANCDTPQELITSNVDTKDFSRICNLLIKQDEGCKKLQPEKRMSCNSKNDNKILSSHAIGQKVAQCLKGFFYDSMKELVLFVFDIIKLLVKVNINSAVGMYKFLSDSDYREKTMASANNAAHQGSRLGKAFLNSASLYFAREFPRNLKKHPFNPMLALGETLVKPLMNFMVESVQALAAHLVPQYQCMNGVAKLHTLCKLGGDIVMPPLILFTFLKSGVKGVQALKNGSQAAKIARFEKRFADANMVRPKAAGLTVQGSKPVVKVAPKAALAVPKAKRPAEASVSQVPKVKAKPKASPLETKPIEELTPDELVDVGRTEIAIAKEEELAGATDEVLTPARSPADEVAARAADDAEVQKLINENKDAPALIVKYRQDPEYAELFQGEKIYPEFHRDIALVIKDIQKRNPGMSKSSVRIEVDKYVNTCKI